MIDAVRHHSGQAREPLTWQEGAPALRDAAGMGAGRGAPLSLFSRLAAKARRSSSISRAWAATNASLAGLDLGEV
jgi:hypothetical protein